MIGENAATVPTASTLATQAAAITTFRSISALPMDRSFANKIQGTMNMRRHIEGGN